MVDDILEEADFNQGNEVFEMYEIRNDKNELGILERDNRVLFAEMIK